MNIRNLKMLLSVLFVLSLPALVCAEISINDNWSTEGKFSLKGENFSAEFCDREKAVVVNHFENTYKVCPFSESGKDANGIVSCELLKPDENGPVQIKAVFSADDEQMDAIFCFREDGIAEVKALKNTEGVYVFSDMIVGVLQGIFLDDIIYEPNSYPNLSEICVPSENMFMGLLRGEDSILMFGWPKGGQKVKLILEDKKGKDRGIEAFKIWLDKKNVYLGVLAAKSIWHRIELLPEYLEKEVEIDWKKPFDATWKTHLSKNEVMTAWAFEYKKRKSWRPLLGFFIKPNWFEGEKTMLCLSKKIPPEGQCFVYPIKGDERTPIGFTDKLPISDIFERLQQTRPYPPGPKNAPYVGFPACWGSTMMQRAFHKTGAQSRDSEFLNERLDYVLDFLVSVQTRSQNFCDFIDRSKKKLDSWKEIESGDSKAVEYLSKLRDDLDSSQAAMFSRMARGPLQLPSEHLAYADGLAGRLRKIYSEQGNELSKEADFILWEFNILSSGTNEAVPEVFGTEIRNWFQMAAYSCIDNPKVVKYAEELRQDVWEQIKCRNWETTGKGL